MNKVRMEIQADRDKRRIAELVAKVEEAREMTGDFNYNTACELERQKDLVKEVNEGTRAALHVVEMQKARIAELEEQNKYLRHQNPDYVPDTLESYEWDNMTSPEQVVWCRARIAELEEMNRTKLDVVRDLEAEVEWLRAQTPEDIRKQGWVVAVHNDYRDNGEPKTFWLFTRHEYCVKGEGGNDAEALNEIRKHLAGTEGA